MTGGRAPVQAQDQVVPVEVIDRRRIEASGAMSLGDLLQTAGNLRVERGFNGATVSLRGLDARHTLILVDGQRLVGRVDGGIDLDRYPTALLERVEIVRGAGSAVYGADAVAGVINLITRESAEAVEADLTASVGTLGQREGNGQVSGRLKAVQGRLTVSHSAQDAFRLDPSTVATSGPQQETTVVAQRTRVALREGLEVEAATELTRRRRGSVDAVASGAVFDRTQLTEMLTARLGITGAGEGRDRAWLRADLNLHQDQLANDQRRSAALDTVQRTAIEQLGLTGQVDRRLAARHQLSVGAEGLGERARSPRLEGEAQRARGAVYAQDEWRLTADGRAVALVSGRLDADSRFGWFASPRLALRFDPQPEWALQTSAGRGFRAPEFTEMLLLFDNPGAGYRVEGDPDLAPERAWTGDVAATWRPEKGLELRLAGFVTQVEGLIQIVAEGAPVVGAQQRFRYANVARARTAGVESQGRFAGRWGWVSGGYTFTHAQDLDAARPLDGRAPHQVFGEVAGRLQSAGLSLSLRGSWQSARPFYLILGGEGSQRQEAPAAHTVDARLAWQVEPRLELFAVGQNLTDQGDPRWLTVPPLRFALGLTARL